MLIAEGKTLPSVTKTQERDCEHCLYYAEKDKKCSLQKCVVFPK